MILEDLSEAKWLRRLIVAVLLAVLVLLAFQVLQPFIVPVIWAVILAYVTWPVHGRLVRLCGGRRELAALLMTLLLSAAIVLPVVWLVLLVQSEALPVYRELAPLISKVQLPPVIAELPMLGPRLQEILAQVAKDPGAIDTAIRNFLNQSSGEMAALIGGVGRNLVKLVIAMVSLFFMYRDGEYFASQVERVLQQFFGEARIAHQIFAPHGAQQAVPMVFLDDDDRQIAIAGRIDIIGRHRQARMGIARARGDGAALAAEMHAGFTALRSHCPMNIEASLPEIGQLAWRDKPAVRADVARLVAMWGELLAQHGGPMLFGPFTIADAYFAPVVMRLKTYALPVPADVAAYMDRVCALPGVKAWIDEALAEQDFIDFEEPFRLHR